MINDIFSDIPTNMSYALYADDCSMWTQGRRILPLIEKMQTAIDRVSRWADQWGFIFSPAKCNAIIFRRYMKGRELENIPSLKIYDQTVTYLDEVKFLGVILDTRLNLNKYVQYVKAKAIKRMALLKCLAGRGCGADRTVLIQIYKAMIRPILEYACQILDGPNNKAVESLECIQNACLRIATGALRTTPIMPLLIETDIYPLRLRRIELTLRYCMKAMSQENHPCGILNTERYALHDVDREYMRRISGFPLFERVKKMCSDLEFEMPADISWKRCRIPPWKMRVCEIMKLNQGKARSEDNVQLKCEFYDLKMRKHDSTFLYTDGSRMETGVGCAVVHGNRSYCYKLPDMCSIFTAEAVAILRALEYVELNCLRNCVICTDSLSVVSAIRNIDSDHSIVIDIMERFHGLLESGYDITLVWIPGHCGIPGNELADVRAKTAVLTGDVCNVQLGYKEYVSIVQRAIRDLFTKLWTEFRPGTALKTIKEVSGKWETSVRTNRREEIVLCRLRVGHTRLTHSYIIDREPRPMCDRCRCPRSVQHILIECPEYANERTSLYDACQRLDTPLSLKSVIGNDFPENIDEVFSFLRNCQLLKLL